MPVQFTGSLRPNEIFGAIYNMIISQQVFANPLKHNYNLVDEFRVDGGMYGDTKLYYSTDVLASNNWGADTVAGNLLQTHRPASPKCQKITLTNFRQIPLTTDQYLSKRAWSTEGAFSSFNSVMLGWMGDTKKLYDSTLFNVYLGTTESSIGKQTQNVDIAQYASVSDVEAKNRLEAQEIARHIANTLDELKDYSRDYNDYKFMRSYDPSELLVIWNTKYINKITKLDLPTMFHEVGIDKFEERKLPYRFFGTKITAANISNFSAAGGAANKPINSTNNTYAPGDNHANGTLRSAIEQDITVSGVKYHLFPGDELPVGATVKSDNLTTTYEVNGTGSNKVVVDNFYIEVSDIICKIIHKDSIPFMSGFETGTSFFNPQALLENHYTTWGYSDLDYLQEFPFITLHAD